MSKGTRRRPGTSPARAPRVALLLLALLPAACRRPSPGLRAAAEELSVVVEAESADPATSYRWDRRAPVPAVQAAWPARIDFGEAGVDETTRFYLPLNEGKGDRVHDVAGGRELDLAVAGDWVDGRFGAGLRLVPERPLSLGPGSAGLLSGSVALSLWLEPEKGEEGDPLVEVPGFLRVALGKRGKVALELRSEPPVTLEIGRLRPEAWNHLGIALDTGDYRQARIVLNDGFTSEAFSALDPPPADGEIVLGGGGFSGAIDDLAIDGHATSTASFLEQGRPVPAPGRHVLRIEHARGTRQIEIWSGAIRSPRPRPEDVVGRLRHAVWDGEGMRRVPAHWERIETTIRPPARTTHPTIYVGNNLVFLFGGETRDSHSHQAWANTNDTWLFHTDEGVWERVDPPVAPAPRCHQWAAYSPAHDLVLYPGGWRNDGDPWLNYDDTWVFHVTERRWERREPSGFKLPLFSNGACVYNPSDRSFLAFRASTTRVFRYFPDADRWARGKDARVLTAAGDESDYKVPGSPMVGYDPNSGRVLLFGGELFEEYHDETVWYDPEAHLFRVLDTETGPSARTRAGFAYDGKRKRFVLFGGVRDQFSQRMDDLWVFEPVRDRWVRIEASGTPPERGGYYGMAYDPDLDRFFLLCGRHKPNRFLDEAWSLSFDEEAPGAATLIFDREAFPELGSFFATFSSPGSSRVGLRFRAAPDLASFGAWSDSAAAAGGRFLQVEVHLVPGEAGEAPRLLDLGFAAEIPSAPEGAEVHGETLAPL